MTTATQARDAIMLLLRTAWTATGAVTEEIPLHWDNVVTEKPGEDEFGKALPWARVTVRHNTGAQDTLAAIGLRRFLSGGTVTVQIFTPFGDGHALSDQIVEVVRAAIRATPVVHTVWFHNTSVAEIGQDGPWFNVNVEAVFRYQEVA
jgi:hypothetical protein